MSGYTKTAICERCDKVKEIPLTSNKWFCSCGAVIDTAGLSSIADYNCIYRGSVTGDLNCGCEGKPKIYACEKHGSCAIRKLKPGKYDVAFCNACEDRSLYRRGRLGLALTCFNAVGGVETWAKLLSENVLAGSVTGIATRVEPVGKVSIPIHAGDHAFADLCSSCEVVMVWGIPERIRNADLTHCIAVHHGSLASSWANECFESQLKWCNSGIAINEEVAKKYGVKYLPNPIIEIDTPNKVQHEGTNILWNHRWATEKRANLMLDIAKLLPNDCKMLVSAPKQIELPANCVNIGQNPDNQKWFDKTDIFLSTASQEAFGYSIAEAVLAEIPVVATPYGIAKDFAVECVDSNDPAVWVQAIMNAKAGLHDLRAKKQQILDQFGPNCHKKWQDFLAALKTV